jgi:hypothetical protein
MSILRTDRGPNLRPSFDNRTVCARENFNVRLSCLPYLLTFLLIRPTVIMVIRSQAKDSSCWSTLKSRLLPCISACLLLERLRFEYLTQYFVFLQILWDGRYLTWIRKVSGLYADITCYKLRDILTRSPESFQANYGTVSWCKSSHILPRPSRLSEHSHVTAILQNCLVVPLFATKIKSSKALSFENGNGVSIQMVSNSICSNSCTSPYGTFVVPSPNVRYLLSNETENLEANINKF